MLQNKEKPKPKQREWEKIFGVKPLDTVAGDRNSEVYS